MNKTNRGMRTGPVGKAPTGVNTSLGKYCSADQATKVKGTSGPPPKAKGLSKVKGSVSG